MTPVRVNEKRLMERDFEIRYFYDTSCELYSCDILILVSKSVFRVVNEPNTVIPEESPTVRLLKEASGMSGKIVWMDSSDSTGVTHFELLPYVDLYLKKQLLKDRSLYRRPLYGGRPYSDFYHREFNIDDSEPFDQYYPLEEEYESKVGLSWNIGLGEHYYAFSWWNKLRRMFPSLLSPRLEPPYCPPGNERPLDVFFRASTNWSRESVVFHRKELIRRLEGLLEETSISGSVSRRTDGSEDFSLGEYRERMRKAKVTFGPFGWGELNLREYEALIFGVLLLRPDVSHMETWPDIFKDGETCVFYRWDFDDLREKLLYYLENDSERQRIAENGQEAYKEMLSPAGMDAFCDWFEQQMLR